MGKKVLLLFLFSLQAGFAQLPAESLKRLLEGNKRYVNGNLLYPNRSSERREEIKAKQNPFAVILGCADSRVAPEILFDQGLGDLFIVRVAGNAAGPIELESIQYSVQHLGSSLIVVLGHQSCGAVGAVKDGNTGDIKEIAKLIEPAIEKTKSLEEAIKANVRAQVENLKKNDRIARLISENKIACIGAYYHLGSGNVEILK